MNQTFVFNNPFFQREEIFQLTKNCYGCYIWLNKTNSKCYVGSSTNLAKRLYFYYGYKTVKITYTSLIINALLSHDMIYFSLIIIILPDKDAKELLNLEQFLIDYYNSEYNLLKKAGSTIGRKLSEEHKAKISASRVNLKYSDESINE
jgi:group I intron endonuclease